MVMLNCNTIYVDQKIRIIRMENWFGLGKYTPECESFNKKLQERFNEKKTYLFYQFNMCVNEKNIEYILDNYITKHLISSKLDFDNIIMECPTTYVLDYIQNNTKFNCILCNHNSMLDYRCYYFNNIDKIYDVVMNARPVKFKNLHLSEKLSNIAYIKGPGNEYPYWEKNYSFMNEIPDMGPRKVGYINNMSKVGLCLSYREGACYASSEFLLSGIPVVSVKSEGGRDVFYNNYNSIIVETDNKSDEQLKKDIKKAVDDLKNIQKDSDKIRHDHIIISDNHRTNFINAMQKIFDENKLNYDSNLFFHQQYFQKMIYNEWSEKGLTIDKIIKQMDDTNYFHIRERQNCYNYDLKLSPFYYEHNEDKWYMENGSIK